MILPYISFTSKQDHLITAPKVVSETDEMSIWQLTLEPDEILICSQLNNLFVWLLSKDCEMEITLDSGQSDIYNIPAGSYSAKQIDAETLIATKLKNASGKPQKFITVEYNTASKA